MKAWFITGVSRGLGRALAQAALARGDTVVGTVRMPGTQIASGPGTLHLLQVDVADAEAVAQVVGEAFARTGGRLDVIVNNAGYGLLGALEDASEDEMQRLFAADVFGPIHVIRAALPRLRAQGSGHIVNVTSIAGRAPGPGSALYAAAKFALEGLSASLAQEVAPLGVKVTAVAPGAFRTDFLSDRSITYSRIGSEAYAGSAGKALEGLAAMAGRQLGDPRLAAEAILNLVDCEDPPLHLLLGSDALSRARAKLADVQAELERWQAVTLSTDFATA